MAKEDVGGGEKENFPSTKEAVGEGEASAEEVGSG